MPIKIANSVEVGWIFLQLLTYFLKKFGGICSGCNFSRGFSAAKKSVNQNIQQWL